MRKFIEKLREDKGFTLAELLIVVAIIAVLVAIAIPVFTTQLEKSKEATDQANIRAAYAEIMTAPLTDLATTSDYGTGDTIQRSGSSGSYTWSATINLKQGKDGWQGTAEKIGGVDVSTLTPKKGGTCTISISEGDDKATITFS